METLSAGEVRPSAYRYSLPPERIAQRPLADRDAAQLLLYEQGRLSHTRFDQLADLLPAGSLLVMNTTQVVPARLHFVKGSGALIELFCLQPAEAGSVETALAATGQARWMCLVGNRKRWNDGALTLTTPLAEGGELRLTATRETTDGEAPPDGEIIRLSWTPAALTLAEVLDAAGQVPLPPYLKRAADTADRARYQTVYAQHPGAVAAPTAGLHFTPAVFESLSRKSIDIARVVLHVGAGTFKPLKAEHIADHTMHREEVWVSRDCVRRLAQHFGTSGRGVVAVGTTTMRTLESLYWFGLRLLRRGPHLTDEFTVGQWEPYEALATELPPTAEVFVAVAGWMDRLGISSLHGYTQLLIVPGYPFKVCQGLITNFHQPESTLLLLVAAFVGDDWQRVYDYALEHDFRFLSYGDSSLLWNPNWK